MVSSRAKEEERGFIFAGFSHPALSLVLRAIMSFLWKKDRN
jgi:hypothetical protein